MSDRLRVSLDVSGMNFSCDVDLGRFAEAWSSLRADNARRRALDGAEAPPPLLIRLACPNCGAGLLHLTAVAEDGVYMRACRRCHHRFPVEGPDG